MKQRWIYTRLLLSLLTAGIAAWPALWKRRNDPKAERAYLCERAVVWARRCVAIAGGKKVVVAGLEQVPDDKPVLYVANHQGALDIPLLMGYLPGCPVFVAKQELFNIPILGYWMRRIGCMPLDRSRARSALVTLEAAAGHVHEGRRLVIFPEGTRSRDPYGRMAPFKRGSLRLALMAGAVVVPVMVEGSRFLLSSARQDGGSQNGEVRIVVGTPVDTTILDEPQKKALPQALHDEIDHMRQAQQLGLPAPDPEPEPQPTAQEPT